MEEESKEEEGLPLTADEWLIRRQKSVALRASRRVFVRCMAQEMPGEKKLRGEWDKLFEQYRSGRQEG